MDVFSRDGFGNKRVDIIGTGASGSKVTLSLAKLGLENIHVWDFDTVESHNIANQAFNQSHVGMPKVEALAAVVKEATGLVINQHNERVDGSQNLGDVVFLLTDTMSSRQEIWKNGLRYKVRTRLMIETRMGSDSGRCYAINPTKPAHIRGWEATLYDDAKAEVSACGSTISVGPTADVLCGIAVWQLIRWQASNGDFTKMDNEIIFGLRPLFTVTRNFE